MTPASRLSFRTTAELPPLAEVVGQPRAVRAIEMGMAIRQGGYNVYVAGMRGATQLQFVADLVRRQTDPARGTPPDFVYVHNFEDADRPHRLALRAGMGRKLREGMKRVVAAIEEELPEALSNEKFESEKQQLAERYQERLQTMGAALEEDAKQFGFVLHRGPSGEFGVVPLVHGTPAESPDDVEKLSKEEQETLAENRKKLFARVKLFLAAQQQLMRDLSEEVHKIERNFVLDFLEPRLIALTEEQKNDEITHYLEQARDFVIRELGRLKQRPGEHPLAMLMVGGGAAVEDTRFPELLVNVLVDHGDTSGPPVVVEDVPTAKNLFGSVDRSLDRGGRLMTHFTRIKAGSLLRANGGTIVIHADDAVGEPYVWTWLIRALKNGRLEPDQIDAYTLFGTVGLKPEPVELDVKVVLVGSNRLYNLLYGLVPHFRTLFGVKAEFVYDMPADDEAALRCASFLGDLCRREGLPHVGRPAFDALLRWSARATGDRDKLLAQFGDIADLVRESAWFCTRRKGRAITVDDVRETVAERVRRRNAIEERVQELIDRDVLAIDIKGRKVGELNGLAVLATGGHVFGRPNRITAAVGRGTKGIVNIEREAKLSGKTHDKGILVLTGYLQRVYAQDFALSLSASLCFEQNYAGVDGDSASSTELYALLSAVGGIPLRQDVAVTGSINQMGEIQAIGGINEKIEGFYDVCLARGLTGAQGVLMPRSNLRHVNLREDVLAAVEAGRFHVWAVGHVDEGLELLSGLAAGTVGDKHSVHGKVYAGFERLAGRLDKKEAKTDKPRPADKPPGETPGEGEPRPATPEEGNGGAPPPAEPPPEPPVPAPPAKEQRPRGRGKTRPAKPEPAPRKSSASSRRVRR